MKKLIYLLLIAILGLTGYSIFHSASTHVEAVKTADELTAKTDSLSGQVKTLHQERNSALTKISELDSTLTSKDEMLVKQNGVLSMLKKESVNLKKMGPIVIHDTVYVTETSNFWGRKKKSIETSSSVDTLELEPVEELVEPVDSVNLN